jgi:hypothetical protein
MSDDSDMLIHEPRNLLDRVISEHRKAHFRFESADGSVIAKIEGFIGRNAFGEILIESGSSGVTEVFEVKFGLDFTCDRADVSLVLPESPSAIRLRFTNGDILLVLGAFGKSDYA